MPRQHDIDRMMETADRVCNAAMFAEGRRQLITRQVIQWFKEIASWDWWGHMNNGKVSCDGRTIVLIHAAHLPNHPGRASVNAHVSVDEYGNVLLTAAGEGHTIARIRIPRHVDYEPLVLAYVREVVTFLARQHGRTWTQDYEIDHEDAAEFFTEQEAE